MLQFSLYQVLPGSEFVSASFDNEPQPRKRLLHDFLEDMYGQEDFYLGEIARAEAGETILNLYNNWVDAQLYPDGRVILEEMRWSDDDEAELGPPARTEITLAEAKQLILDWIAAKKQWRERQAANQAKAGTEPAAGSPPDGIMPAAATDSKGRP
jgi:hypothetical protein